jgi:hypothetical protein
MDKQLPKSPAGRLSAQNERALAAFDLLPDSAATRVPVAAKVLGICEKTTWGYLKTGRLTRIRIGERVTGVRVSEIRKILRGEA